MELPKDLKDEIWDYCRLNDITNIDEFTINLIKQGFTVEKFGSSPTVKIVEKIVDKIVEVEKIIEVIKEVPIEKIIEKEVYITDDKANVELTNKLKEKDESIKSIRESNEELVSTNSELLNELNQIKEELEIEKAKKKRDIYGE